jgi:MYXO-CTERM domain-containing protein
MIANRALPAVTLTLLACVAACSSSSEAGLLGHERTGQTRSAVINGKPSDASQDAVVLLVHYDPENNGFASCTGTLLAPRLVLTARHCVGDTDPYAACKSDGTPIAAGEIRKNRAPDTLYVFTGKNRPDFRDRVEPAGQGMKILDDGGKNLCNHDIALVLLKEPVKNAQIAPIRLESEVEVGELITAVGWGVTEDTPSPEQRQQRKNVKILAVGPDKSDGPVPPNEFEVGESICSGDSGGPAMAQETNAVVGVVSRGGNAEGGNSSDPAASCIDGRNLYTKVAPFKDLIMKGFELAEAEPWLEGQPDPRKAKPKAACTSGDECRSALCLPDPDAANETTCAEDCSATEACSVEGEVCTAEGESKVCRAPKPPPPAASTSTSGCSSTPGSSRVGGGALVFGLLALASLRRKRR